MVRSLGALFVAMGVVTGCLDLSGLGEGLFCGEDGCPEPTTDTILSVVPGAATLVVGESRGFTAVAREQRGSSRRTVELACDRVWRSSDERVATLSPAPADPGGTTATALARGFAQVSVECPHLVGSSGDTTFYRLFAGGAILLVD